MFATGAAPRSKGKAPARKARRSAAGWDNERQRAAAIARKKSQSGRDIADNFPKVVHPGRRQKAAASFEFFAKTYFPETFTLPWSVDHRHVIEVIENVAKNGGLFAYAMPRGSGKTSLVEAAALWSILFGLRRFIVIVAADEGHALDMLKSVKSELENNQRLYEDFPEACYPIRRLEGISHRANGQLFNDQRTHIGWRDAELVLPTISRSISAGAIIQVTGITGGFRGAKHKRPDGATVRPDLVLLDDPQTDESARSPSQCAQRLKIIRGAALGMAGPGKKIAALMPLTVIEQGDMADQILDRQINPEWQGQRTKMVYAWPTCTTDEATQAVPPQENLWERYYKIRDDGLRNGDGGQGATRFYSANRAAMDAGSQVAWPERHNPDELSALQHAMNLRSKLGDQAFFAEYQNDPPKAQADATEGLTADQVAGKVNNRDRGEVPSEASKITAFVDVGKNLLYWCVAAWEDDFTGALIDYGCFPDQGSDYFQMREVKRTLQVVLKTKSLEETIYQGLDRLTCQLFAREFVREDGVTLKIDKLLIDANWGDTSNVVYQFCRESTHAANLTPTHGRYVGAAARSFDAYAAKKGDEIGDHWRRPSPARERKVRYAIYDTNYWKSFLHARLAVGLGGRGCVSIFGHDADEHRLLADHLTAEEPIRVEAKGQTVTEWKIPPSRPDNHWLDCLTGCCVGASMLKISLAERRQRQTRAKRKIKLSEMQGRIL